MNAKEFLMQAWQVDLQVQSKLEQIEALRSSASIIRPSMGREPVSCTRNVTSMQDIIARVMEEEEELNRRIDSLVDLKVEVRKVIDRVEDATLRLILEFRYLLFYPWEKIASELGYTERWALSQHSLALQEVQKILDLQE